MMQFCHKKQNITTYEEDSHRKGSRKLNTMSLRLKLAGQNMINTDGFGKSDPFYTFQRMDPQTNQWRIVHRSCVNKDSLNPDWPFETIDLRTLCHNMNEVIRVVITDHSKKGPRYFTYMGEVKVTINSLIQAAQNSIPLEVKDVYGNSMGGMRGWLHVQMAQVMGLGGNRNARRF